MKEFFLFVIFISLLNSKIITVFKIYGNYPVIYNFTIFISLLNSKIFTVSKNMVIILSFTILQPTILYESPSFHCKIIASDCSGDFTKSYLRSIQEYEFKIRKKIKTNKQLK